MFQAILRVIIFTDIAVLRFPENYYAELAISFLPYIIGILLIGMIISFINLRKYLKKTNIKAIQRNMRGLLLLSFGVLFIIQSNTFNSFYNYKSTGPDDLPTGGPSTNVKVLYANIHKDNTDYSGIETTIQNTNPDLIMFVEFSENHYIHLKDFLQQNYPYINSTTRSKKFIGSMVFSKYKLENRADNFPQGGWRYAFFSIQPQGRKEHYFYLIHTSSPDSYTHFLMRNKQLATFADDFSSHQAGYRAVDDKVCIVGDFNLTPRSAYYKTFEEKLGAGYIDITRELPIAFTRRFFEFPLFWAHIDHIRSNSSDTAKEVQTIDIPGSDHKGLLFTITN